MTKLPLQLELTFCVADIGFILKTRATGSHATACKLFHLLQVEQCHVLSVPFQMTAVLTSLLPSP